MQTFTVSRRIHVTLPDYVYEGLDRWAEQQGRPIASLASFILEVALLEAQKKGELPPTPEPQKKGGV